jgi:hypothetical protein
MLRITLGITSFFVRSLKRNNKGSLLELTLWPCYLTLANHLIFLGLLFPCFQNVGNVYEGLSLVPGQSWGSLRAISNQHPERGNHTIFTCKLHTHKIKLIMQVESMQKGRF